MKTKFSKNIIYKFDKFYLPMRDYERIDNLLFCDITVIAKEKNIHQELHKNKNHFRDVLYTWLQNQNCMYLLDPARRSEIQEKFLNLINTNLKDGITDSIVFTTGKQYKFNTDLY